MAARRVSRSDSEHPLDLKFDTLLDALYFEGKLATGSRGVTFIDDEGQETHVSYLVALEKSLARANVLQRRGLRPGEPVIMILPTSRDFLYLFFGLLYVGAIPAPLAPPTSFAEVEGFGERVRAIANLLGTRHILTAGPLRDLLADALPGFAILLMEDLRAEGKEAGPAFARVPIRGEDVALIQCTSGSTGLSKAVMLTHENLISNVYQIGWNLGVRSNDVGVSWLPLYHDMGLIGCLLASLYWNLDAIFMSPLRFLQRPATWLETMSEHRGTISTAPNFAYGYVASRVTDDELAKLDLTLWRSALCGAEPIDAQTLTRFLDRLRPAGLRRELFVPCYGLAEATLAVTFHELGKPLVIDRVERERLALGEVVDASAGDARAVEVVSCGKPLPESRVRIVDATGAPLAERRVGRVQVAGPTVMRGYFRDPERTAEALSPEGWLETGDLGYVRDGALRITGRAKDLVIVRGRKYAPTDFERAAEEVPGVRRGCAVAFGHLDPAAGTEAVVLVCETDVTAAAERADLEAAISTQVLQRTGLRPQSVVLIPRGSLTKTSSGKLQRSRTRDRWIAGELDRHSAR
jgi:fatty-acyl-CoA synthase